VIDLVKELFGYKVKYEKAWKAKQAAFQILYGDWEEAYNRLPRLLGALAASNPGTYHVVEPLGSTTRLRNNEPVRVFGRAFWVFDQCIRAFQHCRPVISIDGTFLTGRFKGTLLVAIGHDAGDQLLHLAFALVSAENNDNWVGVGPMCTNRYGALGRSAMRRRPTPRTVASDFRKMGPQRHVSRTMKPSTMALYCAYDAGDRGVMHLCLEPQRVTSQKRLFCEIFSRTGYFILKFTIKVNFVKIATQAGSSRTEIQPTWPQPVKKACGASHRR
jgi:hypothetical protein